MLRKKGLPVTPGTLYLAHFAGGAGAVAMGVLLGKSRRNLTSYFGISPQFQGFVLTAPASQVRTVRPDQVEPGFIEKLTQSRRARAFVLPTGGG
jgi:hypothetical protein